MSSYLTFYIVPKDENSKPVSLISYSRNNQVYQYFNDTIHPAYIGMEGETQYTELTLEKINEVISELNQDLIKVRKRLEEYEKHASGNMDIIEEILNQKEWMEELQSTLNTINFIKELVVESTYNWSDYNKILCNID